MAFIAITFWLLVLGLVLMQKYLGKPTNVTLFDYQRGILYKKGKPVREVGPGNLRVWAGMEKVIIIDMRPVQLSFDNRAVALTDGSTALYGFSGSATIRDARKALYSTQNYSQAPACVLLCCSRVVLNGHSSSNLQIDRGAIEQQIVEQAKPRLESLGFELLSFRLTQLSLAASAPREVSKLSASSAN
jgi:hypothetical protein